MMTLVGCNEERGPIESIEQLNDPQYTIGYEEGQSAGTILLQTHPKAKLKSFGDKIVGYESLRQGKIDGFAFERLQMQAAIDNGLKDVQLLNGTLGDTIDIAVGISRVSKIPELEKKINDFIDFIEQNGTLDDMRKRWLILGDEKIPDIAKPENPTLLLKVGTSGLVQPYSYYKDNALNGFDIEFSKRFALWLNAKLQFGVFDYGAIVAAAVSGEVDCIVANLNVTKERKERISFSKPVCRLDNAVMVKKDRYAGQITESNDASKKDVPPQFRNKKLKYNSIAEMNKNDNLKLGMQTGFVFVDKETRRLLPNAKIDYYKSTPDMAYLVANGKLDGFVNDEPVIRYAALENPNLGYIHAGFEPMDIVAVFPKNENGRALRDELNEFIERYRAKGLLDSIDNLWLGHDETKKVVTFPKAKNGKPTLKMATSAVNPPFEYIKNGEIVGYEMDLMARFCDEMGYGLEVHDVAFESVILGIETGMYDFAASTLSATPAFKEKNYLSNAFYVSECVMAVQIVGDEHPSQTLMNTKEILDTLNRPEVKIGTVSSATFNTVIDKFFPKSSRLFFKSHIDMAKFVEAGKMDAMLVDEPTARLLVCEFKELEILDKTLEPSDYAYAFPKSAKGELLRAQMNEFIQTSMEQGLKMELEAIWFGSDESLKKIDLSKLKPISGTLRLAINSTCPPFTYIKDNAIVGYDIDWIVRFCEAYGYGLEISDMNFEAILPSLAAGTSDLAAGEITVTEERKQSVYFSAPVYNGGIVAVVKNGASNKPEISADEESFAASLKTSFERTFVREDRWKLVLQGIGVTIFISILSAIFGNIIGFIVCLLRLSRNKIADAFAITYIRILQGTPAVVLLMILFYVVFARSGLDGVWVAIIGFGMNFGAYVSEMMRTGIEAVDKGQMEAALSLGYTKTRAFFKIVFPQAARHFLPVYQGEFISMVKMTSVVGYIAVLDLTKASDIIRSRTYEAFFPLVITAIIYFLIAWALTRVLTAIQKKIDPKNRKKVRY
jgi:polar amino acid transport system substrate-binding protein